MSFCKTNNLELSSPPLDLGGLAITDKFTSQIATAPHTADNNDALIAGAIPSMRSAVTKPDPVSEYKQLFLFGRPYQCER